MFNPKDWIFSFFLSKFLNIADSVNNLAATKDVDKYSVTIPASDGCQIRAFRFSPVADLRDFVIILHRTGSCRRDYGAFSHSQMLRKHGYGILVPDCRGFADSQGKFSMDGVNLDIEACFRYLRQSSPARIHIVSHSLGSGIAAEYCRYARESLLDRSLLPDKTVMMCPFTSVVGLMNGFSVWRVARLLLPWMEDRISGEIRYNTLQNATHIPGDLLSTTVRRMSLFLRGSRGRLQTSTAPHSGCLTPPMSA